MQFTIMFFGLRGVYELLSYVYEVRLIETITFATKPFDLRGLFKIPCFAFKLGLNSVEPVYELVFGCGCQG